MRTDQRDRKSAQYLSAFLMTAALVTVIGCSTTRQVVVRGDDAITADINAQIAASSELSPYDIEVATKGGFVQLSGSVESDSNRTAVGLLADSTPGVRAVDNGVRFGGAQYDTDPTDE